MSTMFAELISIFVNASMYFNYDSDKHQNLQPGLCVEIYK